MTNDNILFPTGKSHNRFSISKQVKKNDFIIYNNKMYINMVIKYSFVGFIINIF